MRMKYFFHAVALLVSCKSVCVDIYHWCCFSVSGAVQLFTFTVSVCVQVLSLHHTTTVLCCLVSTFLVILFTADKQTSTHRRKLRSRGNYLETRRTDASCWWNNKQRFV